MRRVRRLLFTLHLGAGLTGGALLAVLGLTGSLLVFRDEIDRALNPELLVVEPEGARRPLAEAIAAVRWAYPGSPVLRVNLARAPDHSHEIWLGAPDERMVYVDPYRGAVLGSRRPTDHLAGFLFHLHKALLAGERGETVVGAAGFALLLLGGSGLYLWWPGRRKLRIGVTVRRDAGRRRLYFDLHRVWGALSAALLLVAAVTGISLVFHDQFAAALDALTGSPSRPAPPRSTATADAGAVSVDRAVAAAEQALPGGITTYVIFPAGARAPYTVRRKLTGESHPNGRSFVYVDRYSGRVLLAESGLAAPLGTRLYNVLYPTHIGAVAGTAGRLLVLAAGLAPAVLYVTGLAAWRLRTRRRPARVRGAWRVELRERAAR